MDLQWWMCLAESQWGGGWIVAFPCKGICRPQSGGEHCQPAWATAGRPSKAAEHAEADPPERADAGADVKAALRTAERSVGGSCGGRLLPGRVCEILRYGSQRCYASLLQILTALPQASSKKFGGVFLSLFKARSLKQFLKRPSDPNKMKVDALMHIAKSVSSLSLFCCDITFRDISDMFWGLQAH